ncbi:hypothetical protein B0T14DRAFT_315091 [Immersiella caudata]|uniref:Uncharacterized protein n=1 Tax=Immersiella caudata TaxID=314043 RepID=A0AA39W486_9PEZI|nr:hypothetical protein B0T14DRAFT_315091 [Immersiella caudata]
MYLGIFFAVGLIRTASIKYQFNCPISVMSPEAHVFYIHPSLSDHRLNMRSSFHFDLRFCFPCVPRSKRRKALFSPQPPLYAPYTEPPPPPETTPKKQRTTKMPAVGVEERDMHDILGYIFEEYEVSLNRDEYWVTAHRKLSRVSDNI